MELQQSPLFASYIQALGWIVLEKPEGFFYIKKIPFMGSILKIQRIQKLPPPASLLPIIERYRVHTLAIEPDSIVPSSDLHIWISQLPAAVKISTDYFLPTKTIRITLSKRHTAIFDAFSEAKRRGVRRAQKNNITISQSDDINSFVRMKNRAAGFLGSITTYGIDKLWPQFAPKNGTILLARSNTGEIVGGILLLFWQDVAYYWIAGATKEGKKLFAPTLLVWEAIKVAKAHKAKTLDFVGVWDERLPTKNTEWKGFTKFKEGFGGSALYYPLIH